MITADKYYIYGSNDYYIGQKLSIHDYVDIMDVVVLPVHLSILRFQLFLEPEWYGICNNMGMEFITIKNKSHDGAICEMDMVIVHKNAIISIISPRKI